MLPLPQALKQQFKALLKTKGVSQEKYYSYLKWLRYYLDFCHKYGFSRSSREALPHFLGKLEQKRQGKWQQQQASEAVFRFFELLESVQNNSKRMASNAKREDVSVEEQMEACETESSVAGSQPGLVDGNTRSRVEAGKSLHEKWKSTIEALSNEIKVRHYSPKTLKACSTWAFKLRHFTRSKDPELLAP